MSMESWSTKPRRRKPPDVFTHLLTRPRTAENLCHGAFADPFIQVVDDLGAAIVEHQLRGSAFRSTDGQSRCFAARERLFRPGRDKFPLDLRREPKDRCGYRGRQRLVEYHPILGDVHRHASLCGPPAATPALGEWIALNERPRLRPARHPHRPSRAVARSPGLSKTSDRWWCPPQTRSEQCLESCNSRALRASGSRRPACGWTLEDRRNWPRVQRNGRWEMLWTLSVHNNSMGSVPIRSPNTIPFSGHRCRSTS